MRILKVQFKNLNSLEGEWLVDFEHPDYVQDGLFLITGPTGSGKTTLLDAISLSLYGRTPRVDPSKSQNEVMTRHTGECWAETTFETAKGRFRARWEQSRARARAGGAPKFKDDRRMLADALSNRIIAEKKTDVEKNIKEISGLDFNQFTRAVMLAQGRFAEFLNASENDKSAILEKLTDTSIYSILSSKAFARQKAEKEKLGALEAGLAALSPLNPDAEREKRAEVDTCRKALADLQTKWESCQKKLNWLEGIRKLKSEADDLEKEKKDLLARLEKFEPERRVLEAAKSVAPLAGEYSALCLLRSSLRDIVQQIDSLAKERACLDGKASLRSRQMETAKEAVDLREHELKTAIPILERAAILDADINNKTEELKLRQQELVNQKSETARKIKDFETLAVQLATTEADLGKESAWLQAHAGDEWLVENLSALEEKIGNLEINRKEATEISCKADNARKSLDKLEREIRETEKEIGAAAARIERFRAVLADLDDKMKSFLKGETLENLRARLTEKLKDPAAAMAGKNLEERRKRLRPGMPCPLCGALDHPYVTGNAPDPDLWKIQCEELEARIRDVERLRREEIDPVKSEMDKGEALIREWNARLEGKLAERKLRQAALEEEQKRATDSQRKIRDMEARVRVDLEPLGMDASPDMARLLKALKTRLGDLLGHQDNRQKLEKGIQAMRQQKAALSVDKDHAEHGLTVKSEVVKTIQSQLETLRSERNAILPDKTVALERDRLDKAITSAREDLKNNMAEYESARDALIRCESNLALKKKEGDGLAPGIERAEKDFLTRLCQLGIDEESYRSMAIPHQEMEILESRAQDLAQKNADLEGRMRLKKNQLDAEFARRMTDKDQSTLEMERTNIKQNLDCSNRRLAELDAELKQNDEKRARAADARINIKKQEAEYGKWARLNALIGSEDGKKFRAFVQNVTLDLLLEHANRQLANIYDRYILKRAESDGSDKIADNEKAKNLEIMVIDTHQAGELRTIKNLSGGEVFIISLALALGLSTMAGKNSFLGSLFLDEGFGTLDGEMLETAINAISSLRRDGRIIGVISHIEALREKIPVKVQLRHRARGRSVIEGPGCSRIA